MVINLIQKSLKSLTGPVLVTFSRSTKGVGKEKIVKIAHLELSQRLQGAVKSHAITGKIGRNPGL